MHHFDTSSSWSAAENCAKTCGNVNELAPVKSRMTAPVLESHTWNETVQRGAFVNVAVPLRATAKD